MNLSRAGFSPANQPSPARSITWIDCRLSQDLQELIRDMRAYRPERKAVRMMGRHQVRLSPAAKLGLHDQDRSLPLAGIQPIGEAGRIQPHGPI